MSTDSSSIQTHSHGPFPGDLILTNLFQYVVCNVNGEAYRVLSFFMVSQVRGSNGSFDGLFGSMGFFLPVQKFI